ncbi:SRR1-domain-containing protein [Pholiota molesta]|nr:SRR1-domain-containing protein [Pholiota molesta]
MSDSPRASFSYSEFTPVKARKIRRHKNRTSPPLSAVLATLRDQLRQEEWFAESSHSWNEFSARNPEVLCLGLGSPSASPIARIQLAFLAETCKQLNIAHDAVSVYDPVFTADDLALLAELQMHVLPENRSTHYALEVPTLCFMPHCDIELYDAVLRANWSTTGLSNLFILGNRLQEYVDNKPTSALESAVPCLLRAASILESRPLPASSAWPTAFNNTSAQFRHPQTAVPDALFAALPGHALDPDALAQLPVAPAARIDTPEKSPDTEK